MAKDWLNTPASACWKVEEKPGWEPSLPLDFLILSKAKVLCWIAGRAIPAWRMPILAARIFWSMALRCRAVLDWEFAFSGNPAFDFGNLLRANFGPAFEQCLAAAYREAGGQLPDDWRRISLMADLYSWLDFLNRPSAGPALIADAERIMRDTNQDLLGGG